MSYQRIDHPRLRLPRTRRAIDAAYDDDQADEEKKRTERDKKRPGRDRQITSPRRDR